MKSILSMVCVLALFCSMADAGVRGKRVRVRTKSVACANGVCKTVVKAPVCNCRVTGVCSCGDDCQCK